MALAMPELDCSLELLEDFHEKQACESAAHGASGAHDTGPATHYARVACGACGLDVIKAYCQAFTTHILNDGLVMCHCTKGYRASEIVTVLEPIN